MNCYRKEVPITILPAKLNYFTLNWENNNIQLIFNRKHQILFKAITFIEFSLQKRENIGIDISYAGIMQIMICGNSLLNPEISLDTW